MVEDLENRRRHTRQDVTNIIIDINDGTRVFAHNPVCNVSIGGLLVDDINCRFGDGYVPDKYMPSIAVVGIGEQLCRVNLVTRWISVQDNRRLLTVGFEVVDNAANWFNFIRSNTSLIRRHKEDIWGIHGDKYQRSDLFGKL